MTDIQITNIQAEQDAWEDLNPDEVVAANISLAAVRQYLTFLQANPIIAAKASLPDPYIFTHNDEDWRRVNRAMGTFHKSSDQNYLRAERTFGEYPAELTLRHLRSHENACERVVTGTKTVTKQVPTTEVEYTEVEVEEDIVEWKCPDSWR